MLLTGLGEEAEATGLKGSIVKAGWGRALGILAVLVGALCGSSAGILVRLVERWYC